MKKQISLVVACDNNYAIGKNDDLPWPRISADMKFFKSLTYNNPIVMGRKTFDSFNCRILSYRTNIVLSKSKRTFNTFERSIGCEKPVFVTTIDEAIVEANSADGKEIFIIGGATLYDYFWDKADNIYLTKIMNSYEGDTFIKEVDTTKYKMMYETIVPADEKNPELRFQKWSKK